MAALAEAPRLLPNYQVDLPVVSLAREEEYELDAQWQFSQWLGSISVSKNVAVGSEKKTNNVDLLERLQAAKDGSAEALASATANIKTSTYEAALKRHIGETYMSPNEDGDTAQYGQTNDSVHGNAITLRPNRHPILQGITRVEGLNRFRIEKGANVGRLDDHYFVVVSLVPNKVPEEDLGQEGDGYFVGSLTMSIQATTKIKDGRIKIESAFMDGVDAAEDDEFEDLIAKRFDFKAIAVLYDWFGLEAPRTAEEALDNGLMIHKSLMPNGIIDFMRWVDMAADEVLGRQVERKIEDYVALKQTAKLHEASLEDVVHKVRTELLAATGHLKDAKAASQLMWDLVRKHTLINSYENTYIDPRVFGRAAAPQIEMVRLHLQNRDYERAENYMKLADEYAVITGCGGGSFKIKIKPGKGFTSKEAEAEAEAEANAGSDSKGSRAFRCRRGHLNIRPRNETIDACQRRGCKAEVSCGPKSRIEQSRLERKRGERLGVRRQNTRRRIGQVVTQPSVRQPIGDHK